MIRIAALTMALSGCVSTPKNIEVQAVTVEPVINRFGVPECSVDGKTQPFTIKQNRDIINAITERHCPIN